MREHSRVVLALIGSGSVLVGSFVAWVAGAAFFGMATIFYIVYLFQDGWD